MKEIKDILCNEKAYGKTEDESNTLIGSIIVNNGKIEGFLRNIRNNNIYFTFGIIDEDNIELVIDRNQELPLLLKMQKEGFKYYGKTYLENPFVECLMGTCQISLMTPEIPKKDLEEKTESLEEAIIKQKQFLSKEVIELYSNMIINSDHRKNK